MIKSDSLKFQFWKNKIGGDPTKAFTNFSKYGLKQGDVVEIAYKEEAAEFSNEKGKNIKFTRRTILDIRPDSVGLVKTTTTPDEGPGALDLYVTKEEFNKKVDEIRQVVMVMAEKIGKLEK